MMLGRNNTLQDKFQDIPEYYRKRNKSRLVVMYMSGKLARVSRHQVIIRYLLKGLGQWQQRSMLSIHQLHGIVKQVGQSHKVHNQPQRNQPLSLKILRKSQAYHQANSEPLTVARRYMQPGQQTEGLFILQQPPELPK